MATGGRGVARRGQRWRHLAVWLHVLTSVGWMSQALALVSLLALSLASADGSTRLAATSMARHLDIALLAPLANASAFTGLLLAATTSWGFFRHWWVLVKFAITLTQLYLGIFVLSGNLEAAVAAARSGRPGPTVPLIVGGALMAGAIGFQAWLSIVKPFGRTPWAAHSARWMKLPTAPSWVFATAVAAVLADLGTALALRYPMPAASAVALALALGSRRRAVRQARDLGPSPAPAARASMLSASGGRPAGFR